MLVGFYKNALLLFALFCICSSKAEAKSFSVNAPQKLYFIENKGQIKDQYNTPRKGIQYSLLGQGVNIFISDGQLHYQFFKKDICPNNKNIVPDQLGLQNSLAERKKKLLLDKGLTPPWVFNSYRMDVELLGANKNAIAKPEDPQEYYENYYLPGCPAGGIQAHTYTKLVYKNIYPCIDWVLYIKDNKLEYDFVINPGGDVRDIKIRYNGATGIAKQDGRIIINSPLGNVSEQNIYAYEQVSGKPVAANFKFKNNTLGFSLPGAHELKQETVIIDPVLEWGTYYGPDSNISPINALSCDDSANIYGAGNTFAISNIATVGSFQSTYAGDQDAYLVKFDSSGHRLWATYYGGSGLDCGEVVTCDGYGNVYMAGYTQSTDGIATPGSHQPALAGVGASDGFLFKFNSAGQRIWATYYGGDQQDVIYSVVCDNFQHVYISGCATSTFNIATAGSFEPVFINPGAQNVAGFLAQFDTSGVRNWGTYYKAYNGDTLGNVYQFDACTDGLDIFIGAWTDGKDSVSTPGSWQPVFAGGGSDAFVAKFDNLGNRIWATYYGGEAQDLTGSIACDKTGYVYLMGGTSSDSGISSPGCAQPVRGGLTDAFLVRLDPETSMRIWGTYFGGPAMESIGGTIIATNGLGSVYMVGATQSLSGIASAGAWQTTYGGGDWDAYLTEYDPSGTKLFSTYYGGSGSDNATGCVFDGQNVYICGQTNSINNIATHGSYDSTYDGDSLYNKGFLAKFADIGPGPIMGSDSICSGITITLSDDIAGGTWSVSNTSLATIASISGVLTATTAGTETVTYTLPVGTNITKTVTILALPAPINGSSTNCPDSTVTFSDSTTGGMWASSNNSIATIGSLSGIATGISAGLVTISYIAPDGCYALLSDTVGNCWLADVPVISGNYININLFPNPANSVLFIVSPDIINTISVCTVLGQLVYYNEYNSDNIQINVVDLPAGVYFIKINDIYIRKFIKQ